MELGTPTNDSNVWFHCGAWLLGCVYGLALTLCLPPPPGRAPAHSFLFFSPLKQKKEAAEEILRDGPNVVNFHQGSTVNP